MDIGKILQQAVDQHTAGNLVDAEKAYQQVLQINPDHHDALHFMGVLAYNVGKHDIAKDYINRAIKILPSNDGCYNNMGNIYQTQKDYAQAMQWYAKTIEINPVNKKAYNNLAVALTKLGNLDQALEKFQTALEIDPDYIEARNNMGETYRDMGQYDQAMQCFESVLQAWPDYVPARWNRSILWLLTANFKQGWPEYEWRWKRATTPQRAIDSGKRWNGSDIYDRTLFIYEEQGIGDTIQFMRYLPLLQKAGCKVIFETITPLIRLIESFKGFDRLWVGIKNVDTRPTDHFDYYLPLLSLPAMFGTTLETIPGTVPYLSADENLSKIWKKRISNDNSFKVGVVWAGHPSHANDIRRSVMLNNFKFFKKKEGITTYSLQKEKYEKWTDLDPKEIFEQDLGDQISDFADTAAIIDNMDLVISVDTAVVHLAGALGKEVWVLLPFSPDWRWMIDREDSPWYPTMTLLRQPEPGDWNSVFKRVETKLKKYLE